MRNIVIIGATSAIAQATLPRFIAKGDQLLLIGRDQDELTRIAQDLHMRYGQLPDILIMNLSLAISSTMIAQAVTKLDKIDGILYASGYLGSDPQQLLQANFNEVVLILEAWANYFQKQGSGWMVVLSSVAGDRGRQSNYLYGAAKGGLTIYLQGLRHRLWRFKVRVITIKLGVVDTPMTFGLAGLFAKVTPEKIAQKIADCPERRGDVIYLPWFWRWIMLIIRYLPNFIFHRSAL